MIKQFTIFFLLLLTLDQIWIQGAKSLHQSMFTSIQKSPLIFDYNAAILWYLLASFAYITFVKDSVNPFYYGCLIGLIMYGTFDLTNKVIFKDYTWTYAISDMIWGTFLFGFCSYILTLII